MKQPVFIADTHGVRSDSFGLRIRSTTTNAKAVEIHYSSYEPNDYRMVIKHLEERALECTPYNDTDRIALAALVRCYINGGLITFEPNDGPQIVIEITMAGEVPCADEDMLSYLSVLDVFDHNEEGEN
jgi:hypothetical protein